jgi:hypothetical protein
MAARFFEAELQSARGHAQAERACSSCSHYVLECKSILC